MSESSAHELDAWDAAVAGASSLRDAARYVEFTNVADHAVRIRIRAQPSDAWKMQLAMWIAAAFSFFMSYAINYLLVDDFDPEPAGRLFLYMGFTLVGVAIFLTLVLVNAGSDHDTILDISPGQLKVDRYAAGDHVVRTYAAPDIRGVVMAHEVVTLHVPGGEVHLAASLTPDLLAALVAVIATGLWQDNTRLIANLRPRAGQRIPLCAVEASSNKPGCQHES